MSTTLNYDRLLALMGTETAKADPYWFTTIVRRYANVHTGVLDPAFLDALLMLGDAATSTGKSFQGVAAGLSGRHDLAVVLLTQPGRQIVRDGLHDVRVWLGEIAA